MKRIISVSIAIAFTLSTPPKAQANPAVLAPAAMCSTGVGCIFVGVVTVGGIVYYFWHKQQGRKTYAIQATAEGRVLAHWDTEKENRHWIFTGGEMQCRKMAKNQGKRFKVFIPSGDGSGTCVMYGKQTNYGGGN